MSWENELRPYIEFTSPDGNFYIASWINNERSVEKKLGMFDPPNFDGTLVQDLKTKSVLYPLDVFFDGINHNKDANNFFESMGEVGQWEIIHPIHGSLALQLVSCTQIDDPVGNGNYTAFKTNWIAPANITILLTPDELSNSIIANALIFAEDMLLQLQQLLVSTYSSIQATINTLNKIANFMDNTIKSLTALSAEIQESYIAQRAAFDNALDNYGIDNTDSNDVSSALIDLSYTTLEISTNFSERFSAYNSLFEDLSVLTPTTTTREDLNRVITQEFGIFIILLTIARIIGTSEFETRSEIISAIENISSIFNSAITVLENAQNNFSTLDIDFQFFSVSQAYTSLINIYTLCIKFLLSQFYNLQAEKKFTLKNARSPIEITVTEYGDLGENEENYDLFLTSNNLSGNDILLLPAGKEVVVYVG